MSDEAAIRSRAERLLLEYHEEKDGDYLISACLWDGVTCWLATDEPATDERDVLQSCAQAFADVRALVAVLDAVQADAAALRRAIDAANSMINWESQAFELAAQRLKATLDEARQTTTAGAALLAEFRAWRERAKTAERQAVALRLAAQPAATLLYNLAQLPLDPHVHEAIQQTLAPLDAALATPMSEGEKAALLDLVPPPILKVRGDAV